MSECIYIYISKSAPPPFFTVTNTSQVYVLDKVWYFSDIQINQDCNVEIVTLTYF